MKKILSIVLFLYLALGSVLVAKRSLTNFALTSTAYAASSHDQQTPKEKFAKQEAKLKKQTVTEIRFYELVDTAKLAADCGEFQKARKYASELLKLAPSFRKNWNYGNAIHDGNMVLGRIALHDKRKTAAENYLIKAGKTPGSPQLNSFGPNMSLARDLLKAGDVKPVIAYFGLCQKFWSMDRGKLAQWTKEAKQGKIPNFGANLRY